MTEIEIRPEDTAAIEKLCAAREKILQQLSQVIVGQNAYTLNLRENSLAVTEIAGHTAPIPANDLPGEAEARRLLIEHLRANGFDVSSLE